MRFLSVLLICYLYQFALAQIGGNNYALFFANDDYRTPPGLSDLKNPVRDALAIEKELKEMYSFKTELHKKIDRKAILSTLQQWQNRRFAENDQLFIFFSGHGAFEDYTSTGYFVPKTTSNDHSTFMDLTKLGRIITKIGCRHILLAIDACYSGTIVEEIALKSLEAKRPQ